MLPLLPLLAFLLQAAAPAAPAADRIHVVVLHTNDVHGQVLTRKATWLDKRNPPDVGGLPRVAALVNAARAECAASGAGLLVVDAGDWYQGTPEGMVDDGLGFVRALAEVGYDACALGNHEFDRGIENVKRLLRESRIPAVCANLEERASGKPVEWVEPLRLRTLSGRDAAGEWTLRVALVGLLTPVTPDITHPDARGLVFVEPAQALGAVKQRLAGKVDWILPLTHLGVKEDHQLARAHPDLALIVGGHSHTFLKEGELEGTTCIVQTGSKAGALGRVDLWFDRASKQAVDVRARLIDLREEPEAAARNAAVDTCCAELARRSDEPMRAVLGQLSGPLARAKDPLVSGSAGNFIADVLREHTGADVGLMNRGGIRADIEAGPFTRRQVFELCPFDNRISVLELTGAELVEMARRSVEDTAHSGLELSGMTIEAAREADGRRRFVAITVGGRPPDAARKYQVAMNSFMADGGDAYLDKDAHPERRDEALFVRELIELHVTKHERIVPAADNRYVLRNP